MNRLQLARFTRVLAPSFTEAPELWRVAEETRKYTDGHTTYRVTVPCYLKSIVQLRQLSKVVLVRGLVDTCFKRMFLGEDIISPCAISREVDCVGELLVRERDLTVALMAANSHTWDIERLKTICAFLHQWSQDQSSWEFAVIREIMRGVLISRVTATDIYRLAASNSCGLTLGTGK